ncbi:hypothetical protein [Methylocapsa sp. S129]|uniref:hypothetical protein n=1 Tax=Methylocapsa sp. S129 TaxID=1641869 RepID=UPI00131AE9E5|nr:hypothetical protein [Methylocapsa sp. S129]
MNRFVVLVALACFVASAAKADDFAASTRQTLESGQLAVGELAAAAQLSASPNNNEARFGLGLIRFARAIERYGQTQYRYGLRAPQSVSIPLLRFPVPVNPAPEELSYEKQRDALKVFLGDLADVEATLAPMTDNPVKIVLDLNAIKFDLRGDGKPDDAEKLSAILASLRMTPSDGASKTEPFEVAFDNADALWLRGYAHLLSASIEFVLAYDWRLTFEEAGELFYPRIAPTPFAKAAPDPGLERDGGFLGSQLQIADTITLVHEIRWPVVEPSRLQNAHAHLKQVIALNRRTWKVILARTDDDRVWIPGPQQKHGVIAGMPVGQEQVNAWLKALDEFDDVLDGKRLLPHWRFAQGVNFKKIFFEPRPFDLVLWATGQAAAPYLEAGPILSAAEWTEWQRIFNGNFPGYAFWFN